MSIDPSLPDDVIKHILESSDIQFLGQMRGVDKRSKKLVDECVSHALKHLAASSDTKLNPIKTFLTSQGDINTESAWRILHAVKDIFGFNTRLPLSEACSEASEKAAEASEKADSNLMLFKAGLSQLKGYSALGAILRPLTTANEIRAWMASPDSQDLLDSFVELNLTGSKLKEIPPEIKYFKNLEALNLSSNQITQILPYAFGGLSSLKTITLTHNKITKIFPNAFAGLPALETIDLRRNELQKIPDDVCEPSIRDNVKILH